MNDNTQKMQAISVLMVGGNIMFGQKVVSTIQNDFSFKLLAQTNNGCEATTLISYYRPDIILISNDLTDTSAYEEIRRFLSLYPNSKFVGIVCERNISLAKTFLAFGAKACIVCPFAESEFVQTIKRIAIGKNLVWKIIPSHSYIQDNFNLLTKKEKQILWLIGNGFGTKEIMATLCLKLREIEMHRYNIKLKLKVQSYKTLLEIISDAKNFFDESIRVIGTSNNISQDTPNCNTNDFFKQAI